ncbi:molybdate ABC transporter substrate-binding protein [Afifella pfennigii]|uniref:molybdate ABC transporter substrate-binding protein n=1 Tax=Afifella pfennigii TaxID=209897 RepID=UPI00047894DC|nr:molybdate ABC transporter substrate-binding protein [Afifella pfennigii]
MKTWKMLAAALAAFALSPAAALAGATHVAVAANFTDAATEIAAAFKEKTGEEAVLSFGSTGQLYTQISQGAPYEVFLAADAARPERAVAEGLAVDGSRFTYAIGRIVLWSADPDLVEGAETLKAGAFDKLAIANPATAPYGAAALEAMRALSVYDGLKAKIVTGNNIAQAFQFVQTGNAELGFVALSQIAGKEDGSRWQVPVELYQPIRQDAVLLTKAAESDAAKAFLAFLKGPEAGAIIEKYGYATGAGS